MGLRASNVPELSADMATATAESGAATCNHQICMITSEALTTAAGADYTLTLTNSIVDSGCAVFVSVGNGTNTTAPLFAHSIAVTENQVVILVRNAHASAAVNGTITLTLLVI